MNKKWVKLGIFVVCGLLSLGTAAPQGTSIKCSKCTRFPSTNCWPECDWQDLADPGCITDGYEPCVPNLGRRYTITWTGQSVLALPDVRVLWCRGATASYQVCHPGSILYTYNRGCPPIFYPPASARGSFVAEASRATATPVLQQWCGGSGVAQTQPSENDIRIGLFMTYFAAVSCGDSYDHSSRVEVTHFCRN